MQKHAASGCLQHQTGPFALVNSLGTLHRHADGVRISPWANDEVIFELLVFGVIEHVHAGKDLAVAHARIVRNADEPFSGVIADQIVAMTGQGLFALHLGGEITAGKLQSQQGSLCSSSKFTHAAVLRLASNVPLGGLVWRPLQCQHRLAAVREQQRVTPATGYELHISRGLPTVHLEAQWKLGHGHIVLLVPSPRNPVHPGDKRRCH